MCRTAASRLRALKGRTNYGTGKRFAATSVVATQTSSGGILSWLTGGKSYSLPPLDFPLNDVAMPSPLPDRYKIPPTKITTLENGLKIGSELSAGPAASIGLFVDCGSIYETPASYGATHLLERMAFKSTLNRSHFRVVREVEATGGSAGVSASREQMIYNFDALKTYIPQMVELLIDCVRNPAFLDLEVNKEIEKLKDEIGELSKNSQHLLWEAIHSTSYHGEYGNPLIATESAANQLNADVLEEFVSKFNQNCDGKQN